MPDSELGVLVHSALSLAKICHEAAVLVNEARERDAPLEVKAAARRVHNDLLWTKHELEDELVMVILDCSRCGQRVHWVPGEGCALGHWAHAEPAPDDHGPRLGRSVR
jgi:hypothetical protein